MLWHLAFNQLPEINEQLVTGREDIFFGAEFDASAGTHKLPDYAVKYYIDTLAAGPTTCAAASGSTARSPPPSRRTRSARKRG